MKNVLFVDDEPKVLEGLQRMLRPQRHRWTMAFANSAQAALATLETGPFDVLVTDMRMPETDGATLLALVRDRYPGIVRIVLSGYVAHDAALRAAPVAHQFLVKPCDPAKLCEAIERACSLGAVLTDEATRKLVNAVGELPCLPRTYAVLVEALDKPDVSLQEIGRIVRRDVGISAKVLQLVNSAFFGLVREIATVEAAVGYLGLDILKQLVLSIEIFRTFQPASSIGGFSLQEVHMHSQFAAALAARLPTSTALAGAGAVATLLHDVGQLVLAEKLPERFGCAVEAAREQCRPLYAVEQELIGASHAVIGAYLLGLWGLPGAVVEAVHYHHAPPKGCPANRQLSTTAIVHIADALAHEFRPTTLVSTPLDLEYLQELGVADQLPEWRAMAEQTAQSWRGLES